MKTIHILKNVLKRYLQMLLSAALATVITCVVIAVLAIMIFEAEPGSGNEMIEGFLTVWGVAMLWFALPCCGLWLFFFWGFRDSVQCVKKPQAILRRFWLGFSIVRALRLSGIFLSVSTIRLRRLPYSALSFSTAGF